MWNTATTEGGSLGPGNLHVEHSHHCRWVSGIREPACGTQPPLRVGLWDQGTCMWNTATTEGGSLGSGNLHVEHSHHRVSGVKEPACTWNTATTEGGSLGSGNLHVEHSHH